MKFKQEEQNEEKAKISKDLYNGFIDLIQLEVDKITLIESGIQYFEKIGICDCGYFLTRAKDKCCMIKKCLISYLLSKEQDIPEFTIPKFVAEFENKVEPFSLLSKIEDKYEQSLYKLVSIAFEDKDWSSFVYLLDKLREFDHCFCQALAAVKNDGYISGLCV